MKEGFSLPRIPVGSMSVDERALSLTTPLRMLEYDEPFEEGVCCECRQKSVMANGVRCAGCDGEIRRLYDRILRRPKRDWN